MTCSTNCMRQSSMSCNNDRSTVLCHGTIINQIEYCVQATPMQLARPRILVTCQHDAKNLLALFAIGTPRMSLLIFGIRSDGCAYAVSTASLPAPGCPRLPAPRAPLHDFLQRAAFRVQPPAGKCKSHPLSPHARSLIERFCPAARGIVQVHSAGRASELAAHQDNSYRPSELAA